jgi:hypothetical protein
MCYQSIQHLFFRTLLWFVTDSSYQSWVKQHKTSTESEHQLSNNLGGKALNCEEQKRLLGSEHVRGGSLYMHLLLRAEGDLSQAHQ